MDSLQRKVNDYEFQLETSFEELYYEPDFYSKDNQARSVSVKDCLKDKLVQFNLITGENHVINSGIRSKSRNSKVGGAKHSAHLSGYAVDIKCRTTEDRYKYLIAAVKAGFTRIGIHDRFIHLDCKDEQQIVWLY